jgi:DNA-binding response OmpR family regulator
MASTETHAVQRVLLVDDDQPALELMRALLESNGFEVVAVNSVTQALRCIATDTFQVLITDLHMPNAGDGFRVISAMRHFQPAALTILLSAFPDVKSAMEAIIMEADEIVVKPVKVKQLAELVRERLLSRRAAPPPRQSVSEILRARSKSIVANWLTRTKQAPELSHLTLKDEDRTGHLSKLIDDLVCRLDRPRMGKLHDAGATHSPAAVLHGELRYAQGYTPELLVHESRILQVALFETLQNNFTALDFSLLLPDVMTIADEVDAQLTQTMGSFMNLMKLYPPPKVATAAAV